MDAPSPVPGSGEHPPGRPRYRPPIGIPVENTKSTRSLVIAVLVHALIVALLIMPFAAPNAFRAAIGAGGLGPAGGGGGGRNGTGGKVKQERIQFVRTPPPPPAATPPVVRPSVVPPPVVPPPVVPPPTPQPQPQPAAPSSTASAASPDVASNTPGTGGGAGSGGGAGTGPGTGGGTGAGSGTGTGSSVGPGTGGGTGTAYPPAPTELFLPPLPVPSKARGTIVVTFDVDSTGKVLDLHFEPTKDGNYNRKLREALAAIRFRPAVSAQGVPIRARTEITYSL